ncbi:MAG: hypothetical protein H7247_14690 [Polaromonas sp.]|nr:hypothetical protein [Gemmatimonadaceae bacterium]
MVDAAAVLAEAGRVLRPGGILLVVDMIPHEREDYRAAMGHLWLGFGEEQLAAWLHDAGFEATRVVSLAPDPQAKGPGLFTARAVKGADTHAVDWSVSRSVGGGTILSPND